MSEQDKKAMEAVQAELGKVAPEGLPVVGALIAAYNAGQESAKAREANG